MITIHEGFAEAVRTNVERLREGERLFRAGNGLEGVHLMRTSSRRLRSTVRFLGSALDRADRRRLQRGLRDLMSALAPVRDWDVLIEAIGRTPGVAEEDSTKLRARVAGRREAVCLRMARHLEGPAYVALLSDLGRACEAGPDGQVGLAVAAPSRVMRAAEHALCAAPERWEEADDEALHEARKSVKRLRYAIEAFQPAFGRPLARMLERCRELQEAFGTVQDAAMFEQRLRTIRTFAAGQALAHAQARAEEARTRIPQLWERALGRRMMGRLALHLARRAAQRPEPAPRVPVTLLPPPPAQAAS
ncbi:MAG: CHAD domain-containing protein [Planctomycetota bacterium]